MSEYIALFEKYDENARWFEERYDELVKVYDGEFVAVSGNRVVDHDRSIRSLMKRIQTKVPVEEVFVDYVTSRKLQFVL